VVTITIDALIGKAEEPTVSPTVMPEPSFYILSEGAKNGVSSHDTSRAGFHHQDLAAFCEDVNSVSIPSLSANAVVDEV
jgi:hypothetical protein